MSIPAIVIAGGLGTRIAPFSNGRPKSLIEIHGKPFLKWQLELLSKNGITDVVLCLSHKSEQILKYLSHQENLGMNIRYSFDGENQLGTGGAVQKALTLVDGPFYVLYGDSYLLTKFKQVSQFYLSQRKEALMTVLHRSRTYEKPNVGMSRERILIYSKSSTERNLEFIDYGLTILNHSCFEFSKNRDRFDLTDIFADLIRRDEIVGYEVFERYFEVGSLRGYTEFNDYLVGGRSEQRNL